MIHFADEDISDRVLGADVEGHVGRRREDQVPDQRAGRGQAQEPDRGVPRVLRRARRAAHRARVDEHRRDGRGAARSAACSSSTRPTPTTRRSRDRVGEIAEDYAELQRLRSSPTATTTATCCRSSRRPAQDRPTLFFEIIQRHGATRLRRGQLQGAVRGDRARAGAPRQPVERDRPAARPGRPSVRVARHATTGRGRCPSGLADGPELGAAPVRALARAGRALRPLLPSGLELDEHDGSAWLGITPFRITTCAARHPPVPWVSSFRELNVRTCVHRRRQARDLVLQPRLRAPARSRSRGGRTGCRTSGRGCRRSATATRSILERALRAGPAGVVFHARYAPDGDVFKRAAGLARVVPDRALLPLRRARRSAPARRHPPRALAASAGARADRAEHDGAGGAAAGRAVAALLGADRHRDLAARADRLSTPQGSRPVSRLS